MKKELPNGRVFETCNNYDKFVKSFNSSVKWYRTNNKYLGTLIPKKYKNYMLTSEQLYQEYANKQIGIQKNK